MEERQKNKRKRRSKKLKMLTDKKAENIEAKHRDNPTKPGLVGSKKKIK